MRQAQLGTSISYLQDQLEQMATANASAAPPQHVVVPIPDSTELHRLEERGLVSAEWFLRKREGLA